MPSMMPTPEPGRDWRAIVFDVLAIVLITAGFGGFGVFLWLIDPLVAALYGFALVSYAGVRLATRGR